MADTADRSLDGTILTPDGWRRGTVRWAGDRIRAVGGTPVETPVAPIVLPGFVDLHVHGGGGADMMAGADAIRTAARLHAGHGTTALLVTTVTAPIADLAAAADATRAVMAAPGPGEARVLGLHLEGPFINPDKLGAQPPFAVPGDPDAFADLAARARIRVVTFAPECDPGGRLEAALHAAGVRAQIGHSLCMYAEAAAALGRGCGATHLFNAMTGVAHRGNGIAGAALAHADHAEIIPDLVHVEAGAILAARRAIPNLYGVTDATAGAGMPDGDYRLGSFAVVKRDGAMRLDDGTLAGSALTMDQALRNLVEIGLPLAEAAHRLSTVPADWIGETTVGRIAAGALADLVVLDDALAVDRVIVAGADIA
ncbi:MAG: amidohydrolase family protein [Alphaproteobacteria bacterium]|jgi:N-acetylglucosamine-6-phosphate deacetylase|nr:amidohydrolase family protein [Alphaproteobacteria bacterium]